MEQYQCRLLPMDECGHCNYRELWGCQGGCLSYTILRHGELPAPSTSRPPDGQAWGAGAVLALSPDVDVGCYDIPKRSFSLHNRRSGLEMEVDGAHQALLQLLDRGNTPDEIVRLLAGGHGQPAAGPVAEYAQRATEKGVSDLLEGLVREGFAVVRPGHCGPLPTGASDSTSLPSGK